MANKGGIVTRKDMFSDDAMNFGKEYSQQLKIAIDSNKQLVASVAELNKQAQNFKVSNNQKDYIATKQAEALATQQAIDAIKKQEAAEISALKIQKERIKTLEEERKAKQATEAAEEKASKAKERAVKLTIEEKIQLEILNKLEKQAALEKLGLVGAYQKLNQARTDAKNKLRDLIAAEGENSKAVKAAQAEFDRLDAKVKQADRAVGDFAKNVGNYPQLTKFGSVFKDLIGAFGITVGVQAFGNALSAAFEKIKQFDQSIADLRAITGASGKDLEFLKKQAIELGKETAGGAVKVVEAYKLIASAKPELLENVEALNEVTKATLTLSKASGMDLPAAATALTDAMNQFGAPAEKAGEFIDALANGAKFGAAEIPQVTDALLKFGAVAKSSNINIQESTALIELLAEKGLKGAEAGTALRNVLLKISAPDALPKEALNVFDKFGISLEKLKDNSIPIQQRLEMLKPILGDNANLVKIFGQENIVAARNILSNTDRLKDLTDKMYEYGTAQDQANERSNTLQGKTERLSATYDSFILSLNEGSGVVSKFFSFFIDGAKNGLDLLIRMNAEWSDLYEKAQQQGGEIGKSQFELFSRGLSPEEVEVKFEKYRKAFFENRNKLEEALKKNEEELAKKNPFGLTNPFGKSIKDYKQEIERLKGQIAQIDAFLLAKGKFLNQKTENTDTAVKPTVDTSKEDKKAEDAARKAALKRIEIERMLTLSLYELKKQRLEQAIQIADEMSKDEEQSDEVRIQALKIAEEKKIDLLRLTANNSLEIERLNYEKLKEENAGNKANLETIEKQHTANKTRINEEFAFKLIEINQQTQEAIDKINEFDLSKYQSNIERKVKIQETALNNRIADEEKRFNDEVKSLGDNHKEIEAAAKKHEENLFIIKKNAAIAIAKIQYENLKAELEAFKAQSDGSEKSAKIIEDIENKLSIAKKGIWEAENQKFKANQDKRTEWSELSAKEQAEKILDISDQMTNALAELADAFSQQKIAKIDEEIAKNDDFYNRQIELAGNDQKQKDLLQVEAEKKRKELEDKKRKEQEKQAKFNKAISIAQIAIQTALAVMKGFADSGYVGAILAGVLGAISLATAIATPIPKYKMGRKGGPAEFAEVGDGYVHEVVEKPDGRAFLTPNKPTLTYLEAGDKVHSTVEDYWKLQRASTMASLSMQGKKLNAYQATNEFDKHYGKDLLNEMKATRKAIEKQKTVVLKNEIDIPHAIWKAKNTNWE